VLAAATLAAAIFFAVLAVQRVPEFKSKEALYAVNAVNEPESALGRAGYALQVEAGDKASMEAVRALECADAHRILREARYELLRDAYPVLQLSGESQRAEALLAAHERFFDPRIVVLIRAEAAVRCGKPADALTMLGPPMPVAEQIMPELRK